MKKQAKKILSWVLAGAMVLGLTGNIKATKAEDAAEKSVTAHISYSDSNWSASYWGGVATADAVVTGDGTYKVSYKNVSTASALDFCVFCVDLEDLNVKVTDYEKVSVKDVKVALDGKEVAVDQSKVKYGNIEKENDKWRIELFNAYGDTMANPPIAGIEDLTWDDTLEVTFTLEGIEWGTPAPAPIVTPSSKPTVAPSTAPSAVPSVQPTKAPTQPTKAPVENGLKKGQKKTSGKYVYQVTKAATAKAAGTVSVAGLSKSGKKAAKLTVPATVKLNGASYKVTAVGKNAMKSAKAKSVVLGKNVKTIQTGAFAKCKKLSTLTVKGTLSTVKKGAFKGCKKTIRVKGAAKKANLKKLKKSGYKKFK